MKVKRKILWFMVFMVVVLLFGCAQKSNVQNAKKENEVSSKKVLSIKQENDLVYHSYTKKLHVLNQSTIVIKSLDLDLKKNQTATLYLRNAEEKTTIEIGKYVKGNDVTYMVNEDGYYEVFAKLSDQSVVDLSNQAQIVEKDDVSQ